MRVKKRDWKKYRRLFILIAITILWLVIAVCSVVDLVKNEKAQNNGEDVAQAGNESTEPFCSPVLVIDEPEQGIALQYYITQNNVSPTTAPETAEPTPEQSDVPTAEPTASTTEQEATPEPTPAFTPAPTPEPTATPTAQPTQEPTTAPEPTPEVTEPVTDNGNSSEDGSNEQSTYWWISSYQNPNDSLVTALGNVIYREVGAYISTLDYDEAIYTYKLLGSTVLHRLELGIHHHRTVQDVINCRSCFGSVSSRNRNGVEECYIVAENLLKNGPIGPKNLIFAAAFRQGEVYYVANDGRWVTYYGTNSDYPAS